MCYRIRQENIAADVAGATPPKEATGPQRLRPGWIGAGAAALVAGLAAAALVMPRSAAVEPQPPQPQQAVAPAAPAAPAAVTPISFTTIIDQTVSTLTLDDGVPAPSQDVARSAVSHCQDGL
jgi:hypothetical protein